MISARPKFYATTCSALLMLLIACSGTPSTVPGPAPEVKPVLPAVARAGGWLPQQRSITQRYSLFDSTTVEVSNDSTAKVIPVVTTMFYSITIDASERSGISSTITSTLDSSEVNSTIPQNFAERSDSHQQFHASITGSNQIVGLQSDSLLTCSSNSNSVAPRLFELIPSYPQHAVKTGDRWTDTVTLTSCHGKTLIKQQISRQYEVVDFTRWEGRDIVKVSQQLTMSFTTLSTKTNSDLNAAGVGSSAAILYLARENGLLLNSNSHSHSELSISTSRGVFPFIQNTTTHITTQ